MPTPTSISELSTTAASNYPAGTESPTVLDDVSRALSAFIAQLRDQTGYTTGALAPAGVTSVNSGQLAGLRNRIINGNFGINQRAVSGTVVLAAGAYGHDRWKAGASGCTYTFATSANVTTLTISAGSLQQVIEGLNLESGTYALSWTGTSTGKIGAGSYAASGVTGAVTGGTNTTIEFATGTVSKVQFEIGTPTVFEQRPYGMELAICQRYYYRVFPAAANRPLTESGWCTGTTAFLGISKFPVTMRTRPTALEQSGTANHYAVANLGVATVCTSAPTYANATDVAAVTLFSTGATLVAGQSGAGYSDVTNGASAYLGWSAEL